MEMRTEESTIGSFHVFWFRGIPFSKTQVLFVHYNGLDGGCWTAAVPFELNDVTYISHGLYIPLHPHVEMLVLSDVRKVW